MITFLHEFKLGHNGSQTASNINRAGLGDPPVIGKYGDGYRSSLVGILILKINGTNAISN